MDNGVTGQIIKDSISYFGDGGSSRLTTIHLRYPRMIHSEIMTHRVFSRNGRSSRAVPVMTLLAEEHYTPHFMKNRPGMVASEELDPEDLIAAQNIWNDLAEYTKRAVEKLNVYQVHKQWANRPLEAFGYIDVLISSTDWANFLALRDDEGAQPEIRSVAILVKKLLDESTPKVLKPGDWHMPYIQENDIYTVLDYFGDAESKGIKLEDNCLKSILRKISVARCARLTIRPFNGDSTIEKELERYERLMVSRPVHASPAEHVATPDVLLNRDDIEYQSLYGPIGWQWPEQHANYFGWRQFRKQIPYNTVEDR